MSKKLARVIEVLMVSKSLDADKVKLETKIYPNEGVVYRFDCLDKDFDLEMCLNITYFNDKCISDLSFGQSFDNDYVDMSYKEFKKQLKKINGRDTFVNDY